MIYPRHYPLSRFLYPALRFVYVGYGPSGSVSCDVVSSDRYGWALFRREFSPLVSRGDVTLFHCASIFHHFPYLRSLDHPSCRHLLSLSTGHGGRRVLCIKYGLHHTRIPMTMELVTFQASSHSWITSRSLESIFCGSALRTNLHRWIWATTLLIITALPTSTARSRTLKS